MRAFVAIELPGAVRQELTALRARLEARGARARWVAPESIHLTLRFLGEITGDQATTIIRALGVRYAEEAPLELHARGTGCFPNARRPNIIWAGIADLSGHLNRVQLAAEEEARAVGLTPETRTYQPHLTLARVRGPLDAGNLVEAMEAETNFDGGAFTASGVTLMESKLTPTGPRYGTLDCVPFGRTVEQAPLTSREK